MNRSLKTMIGLGLVGLPAGTALAQPYVVNLTGATLLENPLTGNAMTNDFFDADGDGNAIGVNGVVDNLNPAATPSLIGASDHWVIQYRLIGSVSGFQELVSFSDAQVTDGHTGTIPGEGFTSKAYFNRTRFINNTARVTSGGGAGLYNEGNPGGFPARTNSSFVAQFNTPPAPSAGFWQADIAPVDVPSLWAVQSILVGPTSFDKTPGSLGYGRNPRTTTNKDGSPNAWNFLLVNLGGRNLDEANPTAGQTIFSTPIAYAPVAALTNLGTGLREVKSSALRHLYVTGRLPSGENLVAITREIGSGTHNSIMNSLCLDPSYGVGEAVGGLGVASPVNNTILGPNFNPGNMLGSGEMELTMRSVRLGIGYSGAERGGGSGWLLAGQLEVLGIINDQIGGTVAVRPTLNAILFNGNPDSAYRIGGIATLNTLGDPLASDATFGGDNNGNPKILNEHAAAFINNITLSIEDFNFTGGTPFTPAEDLANRGLLLPAAPDFLPSSNDPCNYVTNPIDPATKTLVQDFYINVSSNALKLPAYATFGTVTLNGKVPTRAQGVTYSDGVVNGTNYVIQDSLLLLAGQGTPGQLAYGSNLNDRNRIAGDFNGDALRNAGDIEEMMKALEDRAGGSAWTAPDGNATLNNSAGGGACIEILGDFNGDGNFDAQDVRYFADGLAIDTGSGNLDRKAGFTLVDQFYLGAGTNPFGTTLGNPQRHLQRRRLARRRRGRPRSHHQLPAHRLGRRGGRGGHRLRLRELPQRLV
jgi:hypothetical protein